MLLHIIASKAPSNRLRRSQRYQRHIEQLPTDSFLSSRCRADMPARHCSVSVCLSPAARGRGGCVLCCRHFCVKHIVSEFHKCPPTEVSHGVSILRIDVGMLTATPGREWCNRCIFCRRQTARAPAAKYGRRYSACFNRHWNPRSVLQDSNSGNKRSC